MWRTIDIIWVSKLIFAAGSNSKSIKHCVQISLWLLHAPLQSRDGSHTSPRLDSSCTRTHSLKTEWQSSELTFEAQVGFITFFIMLATCVTIENPSDESSKRGVSACRMQWNKAEWRLWSMLPGNVLKGDAWLPPTYKVIVRGVFQIWMARFKTLLIENWKRSTLQQNKKWVQHYSTRSSTDISYLEVASNFHSYCISCFACVRSIFVWSVLCVQTAEQGLPGVAFRNLNHLWRYTRWRQEGWQCNHNLLCSQCQAKEKGNIRGSSSPVWHLVCGSCAYFARRAHLHWNPLQDKQRCQHSLRHHSSWRSRSVDTLRRSKPQVKKERRRRSVVRLERLHLQCQEECMDFNVLY